MSNVTDTVEQPCDFEQDPCNRITLVIESKQHDIGSLMVRRLLPNRRQRMVGPWIFFDHMGPATFQPGDALSVRPHPHIGIATVTYLFAGEIFHRDSLGTAQAIKPGDINLMVTGQGMVHSERERPEQIAIARELNGLQLWLALPEDDEETAPAFYHYGAAEIPTVFVQDVPVRVMIGQAYGVASPVKTFSETLYLEARLSAGQQLELPRAAELGLYIVSGSLTLHGVSLTAHTLSILADSETPLKVTAATDTMLVLIGGAPVGKRFIEWNFVSSRKERIEQAKQDWQAGRFPRVPGDEQAFIPLPDAALKTK